MQVRRGSEFVYLSVNTGSDRTTAQDGAFDLKRTFKAPHNPTTEVLGSFSHKRSPCRERRMRRQEFISGTAAMAATALAQPLSAQTVMSRSIKRVAIVHP
jgi:hypothetical protein